MAKEEKAEERTRWPWLAEGPEKVEIPEKSPALPFAVQHDGLKDNLQEQQIVVNNGATSCPAE